MYSADIQFLHLMCGEPRHITKPDARLPPSSLGMDTSMASQLNVALIRKLAWVIDVLDMLSMGVLYNQVLADVRSTGAGIKCLYSI